MGEVLPCQNCGERTDTKPWGIDFDIPTVWLCTLCMYDIFWKRMTRPVEVDDQ